MRGRVILGAVLPAFFVSLSFGYDWSTNPGDGSSENPYQISMPIQLTTISSANLLDKCFILTNDINLYGLTFSAAVIAPDEGTALELFFQGTPFSGTLDGRGYSIQNLDIETESYDYLGLFGYLSDTAEIRNLHLENVSINSGDFASNIGSLTGFNAGEISDCSVTGNMLIDSIPVYSDIAGGGLAGGNSGTIRRCHCRDHVIVPDVVHVSLDQIGGLTGVNSGLIEDCSATGTVQGAWYAGGLVGENTGNICSSHATGSVTVLGGWLSGGLIGYMYKGTLYNCFASGDVQGGSDGSGGLIGWARGFTGQTTTISSCYAAGNVTGEEFITLLGGLIGDVDDWAGPVDILSCYYIDQPDIHHLYGQPLDDPNMMIRSNFAGWDFVDDGSDGPNNFWRMCEDGVDYPILRWENADNGDYACPDGVGMDDLEALAITWLTDDSDPDFNYACDGSGDGRVDQQEMQILSTHWKE